MQSEGYSVAEQLSQRGYQCFVVSYRLRPYSQEVSALDLARAVRYVRHNAAAYGIDENDIAVVGFSAGGILCGELLLHSDGYLLPSEIDENYVPNALDYVSAEAQAIGHIYSFYGRLSVSDNNVETLRAGNLPPTFYAYGTRDPFYRQFIQNADAVREAGVPVEEAYLFTYGIKLMAWYPLGHGDKKLVNEKLFTRLAQKYGKSNAQIILRWHVQSGHIVIPGSKNPAHIAANLDIFDFVLTDDEMKEIAALDKNKRYYNMSLSAEARTYLAIRPDFNAQE